MCCGHFRRLVSTAHFPIVAQLHTTLSSVMCAMDYMQEVSVIYCTYVHNLMMISFPMHSFIPSFSFIMCCYELHVQFVSITVTCSHCCQIYIILCTLIFILFLLYYVCYWLSTCTILQMVSIAAHVAPIAHSFFSSIMRALDYMNNTTGGRCHCTCSKFCSINNLWVCVRFNNDIMSCALIYIFLHLFAMDYTTEGVSFPIVAVMILLPAHSFINIVLFDYACHEQNYSLDR